MTQTLSQSTGVVCLSVCVCVCVSRLQAEEAAGATTLHTDPCDSSHLDPTPRTLYRQLSHLNPQLRSDACVRACERACVLVSAYHASELGVGVLRAIEDEGSADRAACARVIVDQRLYTYTHTHSLTHSLSCVCECVRVCPQKVNYITSSTEGSIRDGKLHTHACVRACLRACVHACVHECASDKNSYPAREAKPSTRLESPARHEPTRVGTLFCVRTKSAQRDTRHTAGRGRRVVNMCAYSHSLMHARTHARTHARRL